MLFCYDSYEYSLPRFARKRTKILNSSKWMWFEAPNKKELLKHIEDAGSGCTNNTPIKNIPLDSTLLKIQVGDPWIGVSIKRELVKISGRKFLKAWFSKNVFYMSLIRSGKCKYLEIVK